MFGKLLFSNRSSRAPSAPMTADPLDGERALFGVHPVVRSPFVSTRPFVVAAWAAVLVSFTWPLLRVLRHSGASGLVKISEHSRDAAVVLSWVCAHAGDAAAVRDAMDDVDERRPMPKTRYVALLKGINVGKAKRLAMADLRDLLDGLGYTDVVTYLQSGNVAFTASGSAAAVGAAVQARSARAS